MGMIREAGFRESAKTMTALVAAARLPLGGISEIAVNAARLSPDRGDHGPDRSARMLPGIGEGRLIVAS